MKALIGVEAGLSIGQNLNIPIKETLGNNETIQNDPVVNNTPNYNITYSDSIVKHTVLEHETLYSISKRYMVSSDTIQKINNLQGVKVKKGDVLIIPVKKVAFEIVEKQIEPADVIKPNNNSAQLITKTSYSVALVLPLMLAQNEAEMNKPLKVDQVRALFLKQLQDEF